MTITERPSLDMLELSVERPADGLFVLGRSILGGADQLGDTTTTQDLLGEAVQTVTVSSGISQTGIKRQVQTGTLSVTFLDAYDPEDPANWWVIPGRRVRLRFTDYTFPVPYPTPFPYLFTGKIAGIVSTDEIVDGKLHTYTTITVQDPVAVLANTIRYGVDVGADSAYAVWESFYRRARRLAAGSVQGSAGIGMSIIADQTQLPYPGLLYAIFDSTSTADITPEPSRWTASDSRAVITPWSAPQFQKGTAPGAVTFTRTITGLTPGRMYGILVAAYDSDTFKFPQATFTLDGAPIDPRSTANFISAGTSAVLGMTLLSGDAFLLGINLYGFDTDPWALGSTVYESSIASHLDLLTASYPGALWYVDGSGTVHVFQDAPTADDGITIHLAPDERDGFVPYIGIDRAFDTGAIVNQLSVNNHGRAWGDGGWADSTPVYSGTDATSTATWGAISDSLDTNLASTQRLAELIGDVLEVSSTPEAKISAVTVNAAADPAAVAAVKIGYLAEVVYKDASVYRRILGIQHTITPTRWMTTFTLGD